MNINSVNEYPNLMYWILMQNKDKYINTYLAGKSKLKKCLTNLAVRLFVVLY